MRICDMQIELYLSASALLLIEGFLRISYRNTLPVYNKSIVGRCGLEFVMNRHTEPICSRVLGWNLTNYTFIFKLTV